MKDILKFLAFLLVSNSCFGQLEKKSAVEMISEYSSENQEMADLLSFERIDFYNVKFVGEELNNKDFLLVSKEIWEGKIKKVDTLLNTKMYQGMPKSETDTLALKVYAKKTDEPKLKLWFRFPQFGIERKFDATASDDYSLRDVGLSEDIQYGEDFYAFAYILPYEENGTKQWCAVDSSGKDIENWGKEFGLEHYLVFEMRFE